MPFFINFEAPVVSHITCHGLEQGSVLEHGECCTLFGSFLNSSGAHLKDGNSKKDLKPAFQAVSVNSLPTVD